MISFRLKSGWFHKSDPTSAAMFYEKAGTTPLLIALANAFHSDHGLPEAIDAFEKAAVQYSVINVYFFPFG